MKVSNLILNKEQTLLMIQTLNQVLVNDDIRDAYEESELKHLTNIRDYLDRDYKLIKASEVDQ